MFLSSASDDLSHGKYQSCVMENVMENASCVIESVKVVSKRKVKVVSKRKVKVVSKRKVKVVSKRKVKVVSKRKVKVVSYRMSRLPIVFAPQRRLGNTIIVTVCQNATPLNSSQLHTATNGFLQPHLTTLHFSRSHTNSQRHGCLF